MAAASNGLKRQENREILVVDDDAEVRDALCDVLTDEGFMVAAAVNGADALRHLSSATSPSLIIMDLTMPVMDGHEFLERRAQNAHLSAIPVIVVSAAIDARVDHPGVRVLRKPIDLGTLLRQIHERMTVGA